MQEMEQLREILNDRAVLNYMAWERLILLEAARSARVRVTDQQVTGFIANHPLFQRNGRFIQEIYSNMLSSIFRTEAREFEELLRENIMIQVFRNSLLEDVSVSEEEAREFFHKHFDKFVFSYFIVPRKLFLDEATAGEEEVARFYQENPELFIAPEKVSIEYAALPFSSPEQKTEALERLNELFLQVPDASAFSEKAEEMGIRTSSTGLFPVTETIPGVRFSEEVHQQMLDLEEGEISPPVSSGRERGEAYVLVKKSKRPAGVNDFENVEKEARKYLLEEKAQDMAMEKAELIKKELLSGKLSLLEASERTSSEIKTTPELDRNGFIADVGSAEIFVKKAFQRPEGDFLGPFPVRDGAAIAKIKEVIKADKELFEEERSAIKQNMLVEKQINIMQDWFDNKAPEAELQAGLDRV